MNSSNLQSGPSTTLPPSNGGSGGNAMPSPQQLQKQKEEESKQSLILSRILTHEARDRCKKYLFICLLVNRVALVKPERVAMVQSYLVQLAQRGAISKSIDDQELISLLSQVGGINESSESTTSMYTFIKKKTGINDDDDELDLSQFDI